MRYWQAFKYFTLVQFHSNFTLTLKLNCKKFVKKQKQIVLQFYGYIFMLLLQPNSDGNLVFFKFFFSHLMTLAIIVTCFLFFKIKQFHTKPEPLLLFSICITSHQYSDLNIFLNSFTVIYH